MNPKSMYRRQVLLLAAIVAVAALPHSLPAQVSILGPPTWNGPTMANISIMTTGDSIIPWKAEGVYTMDGERVEDAYFSPSDGRLGPGYNYYSKEDSLRVAETWSITVHLPDTYDCEDEFTCPLYPPGTNLQLRFRFEMPAGPYRDPHFTIRSRTITVPKPLF